MRCVFGVVIERPLLLLCLVLYTSTLASCDYVPAKRKKPYPSPVCKIIPDYSSTEAELRTTIFAADTKKAAKILGRDETFGLGEGLRYLPEQQCAVVRTDNPRRDPDVVAYQALALSAKMFGDADRLANSIVVSFELECRCSLFNSTERDRMKKAFRDILKDPKSIQEILEFGGPVEDSKSPSPPVSVSPSPDPRKMMIGSYGRRLRVTENSDTDSFVCAYCRPPSKCNGVVNWCS